MPRYHVGDTLSIPEEANPRYAGLSLREIRNGGRVIGGDKGDIHFMGFTVRDGRTFLDDAEFVTSLEGLTPDEVADYAQGVVDFSYESIGTETVEHS